MFDLYIERKKGLIPIQVQLHTVSDKSDFNPEKSEMGVGWPIRGRVPFSLKEDLIRGELFSFYITVFQYSTDLGDSW